jgi:hypothetical protein
MIRKFKKKFYSTVIKIFLLILIGNAAYSQQPYPPTQTYPQHTQAIYLLSITPKNGGKSYTLFHKAKVILSMADGKDVKGKVKGVSHDSISVEYKSYAIADITELRFNQGSVIGLVAAGALLLGVTAIAVVGSSDQRTSTEDAIFWTGVGLASAGLITLIPTHFIKKRFSSSEYDFTAVMIGSY